MGLGHTDFNKLLPVLRTRGSVTVACPGNLSSNPKDQWLLPTFLSSCWSLLNSSEKFESYRVKCVLFWKKL